MDMIRFPHIGSRNHRQVNRLLYDHIAVRKQDYVQGLPYLADAILKMERAKNPKRNFEKESRASFARLTDRLLTHIIDNKGGRLRTDLIDQNLGMLMRDARAVLGRRRFEMLMDEHFLESQAVKVASKSTLLHAGSVSPSEQGRIIQMYMDGRDLRFVRLALLEREMNIALKGDLKGDLFARANILSKAVVSKAMSKTLSAKRRRTMIIASIVLTSAIAVGLGMNRGSKV